MSVEFNGNTSQWFSEMSKMIYNWSSKQNILIEYDIMLWTLRLQNTNILGDVSDYSFCLQNVDNYEFRSLFNIGNTPPRNRKSLGTKSFQL
jgi:hypothetical protein